MRLTLNYFHKTFCHFSLAFPLFNKKSAASFFIVFYAIYWIAKFYYGKEAFGRGDYWLAMALGSFIHLETLPHFLLLASVLGICFSLIHKKKKEFIPFAPFMNLSAVIIYFVKYYGY